MSDSQQQITDPVLFLDIDGVLNAHMVHQATSHCGVDVWCAGMLNRVIENVPSLKIVLSSAWRYMITRGDMTLRGFEYLMATHGVDMAGRLIGVTDEDRTVDEPRSDQILRFVKSHGITRYMVVDDLPLGMDRFVRTQPKIGLTSDDAERLVAGLFEPSKGASK